MVISQLNEFTYLAMSTKITTLKPTQLRTLCSDLVSYGNFNKYDNNHSVYSIACYNQALKRMQSISKLNIIKKTEDDFNYRFMQTEIFIDPSTKLTDLTSLFSNCDKSISWYVKTVQEIKDVNTLLEKQENFVNKLELRISLPALSNLSTSNRNLIEIKLISNILGPDAKILEYLPKDPSYIKYKFDVNDLNLIAQAITEVREEHDNEYKKSTTN